MKSFEERFDDYWSSRAHAVGEVTRLIVENNPIFRGVLRQILTGHNYSKVLDIGTGAGILAIELARMGYDVTAIDRCQAMLDTASEISSDMGLDIKFYKDDAVKPIFRKASFDVIVTKDCVWNLTNPELAYRNWADILKPGGCLIVMDNNFYLHYSNPDYKKRYDELEEEHLQMLPLWINELKDSEVDVNICHEMAKELPLTSISRPGWDVSVLMKLGFDNIKIQSMDHHHYFINDDGSKRDAPMNFIVIASKLYDYLDTSTAHMLRKEVSVQEISRDIDSIHADVGDVLKCMSNEGCRKLLVALYISDLSIVQCAHVLDVSHALASHDLKLLKEAGLVDCTKVGRERKYYLLDREAVGRVITDVLMVKDSRYRRNQ
jgi:SAM-dependent methyltransferase/DNA-binding transcriptional ArsR family regulator